MKTYKVLWRIIDGDGKEKVKGRKFWSESSAEQFFFELTRKEGSFGGMMKRRNKRYHYYDKHIRTAKVGF